MSRSRKNKSSSSDSSSDSDSDSTSNDPTAASSCGNKRPSNDQSDQAVTNKNKEPNALSKEQLQATVAISRTASLKVFRAIKMIGANLKFI